MPEEATRPNPKKSLWPEGDKEDNALGEEFVDGVLARAVIQVTLREYLFIFLTGFCNILLSLLGAPSRRSSEELENDQSKDGSKT